MLAQSFKSRLCDSQIYVYRELWCKELTCLHFHLQSLEDGFQTAMAPLSGEFLHSKDLASLSQICFDRVICKLITKYQTGHASKDCSEQSQSACSKELAANLTRVQS